MKKILIVDDECPIREWIMYCIKNQYNQTYITDLASNGKEALELFTNNKYDLIITDIEMPVMDGISLCQKVQSISKHTGFIFLSSHSNFEYVHSALTLQAFDYILKTEITEKQIKEIIDNFFSVDELSKKLVLPDFQLKKMFNENNFSNKSLESYLQSNNIMLPTKSFFCFAAKLSPTNSKDFLFISNKDHIKSNFCIQYDQYIYIGCIEIDSNSILIQAQLQSEFINDLTEENPLNMLSVTSINFDKSNLMTLLHTAVISLNLSFYGKSILHIADAPYLDKAKIDQYYLDILELIKLSRNEILEETLYNLFSFLEVQLFADIEFIKNTCFKICEALCVKYYKDDHVHFSNKISEIMVTITNISIFNDLREFTLKECLNILEQTPLEQKNYSQHVKSAILYIKEKYDSIEGINEVATNLFLNPEYFSRIFKKETGLNFNIFLNNYRLKQSIYLMKSTDLKLYEIAENVGFSSLAYYSKRFKEMYGVTPFEYKCNYLQ